MSNNQVTKTIMTITELREVIRLEFGLAKGFRMRSVIVLFRLAGFAIHGQSKLRFLFSPFVILYKLYTEFLLGIELPASLNVGAGLRIYHGVGLVVHNRVKIGRNCILRQGVTLGNKGEGELAEQIPVIGDNVEFGAGSIVIGNVNIGDNAIIGAGVVVTKDIPPNTAVVGAPFRTIIKKHS
jgi:serine acetyltransferase